MPYVKPKPSRAELIAQRTAPLREYAEALVQDAVGDPLSMFRVPEPPSEPPPYGILTDPYKRFFLQLLLFTSQVGEAAALCGWSKEAVSKWRQEDHDFSDAVRIVLSCAKGYRRLRVRMALERRGIDGYAAKLVTNSKGEPITDPNTGEMIWEMKYSDAALMRLADMEFPESRERTGPLVEVNAGVVRLGERPKDYDGEYLEQTAPTIEDAEKKYEDADGDQ